MRRLGFVRWASSLVRRSERTEVVAFGAAVAWLVFYAAWLLARPGGHRGVLLFADTAYLVPIAAATLVAARAATVVTGSQRRFWALVSLANLSWLAGEIAWSVRELAVGWVPFPWWTDVGYVAFWLLLALAYLTTLAARATRRRADALEALVVVAGIAALAWWLVLEPLPLAFDLATVVGVTPPTAALLLFGLVVARRRTCTDHRGAGAGAVAAGLAIAVCTELLYTRVALVERYVSGHWLELGWEAEALCYTVGAVVACVRAGSEVAAGAPSVAVRGTPAWVSGAVLAPVAALVAWDVGTAAPTFVAAGAAVVALWIVRAIGARSREVERQLEDARHPARPSP